MPTLSGRWYTRNLYGRDTIELAMKVGAWQRCQSETGLIKVEILPLYFELSTEMYHRIVRIYSDVGIEQMRKWGDMIEREIGKVWSEDRERRGGSWGDIRGIK